MIKPWKRKVVIGDCTLYQGDCLEVMPLLGNVDHVISDPPYETEYQEAKSKIHRTDGKSWGEGESFSDSLGFSGITEIRPAALKEIKRICVGWSIFFCIAEGVRSWRDEIQNEGFKYDTCLAWVKPDAAPRFNGQGAARGFECAVTAWAGAGFRKWNAGGKRGVYTYCVNAPDRHGGHPTEKPWRLFTEILTDYTNSGQTILDPFMGSGTTLVACAKLGRKGIGIELDPDYFDIACKRVEEAYKQPSFFVEPPKSVTQEELF